MLHVCYPFMFNIDLRKKQCILPEKQYKGNNTRVEGFFSQGMQITRNLYALRETNSPAFFPLYYFSDRIHCFFRSILALGNIVSCSNPVFLMIFKLLTTKSDAPMLMNLYFFKRGSQVFPLKDSVMLEYLYHFNVVIVFTVFSICFCCCCCHCFVYFLHFQSKFYFAPLRNLLNKNNICVIVTLQLRGHIQVAIVILGLP